VIEQDGLPSFYVYEQEFEYEGRRRRRASLIGRLRLEPWETGVVRPHEETMRGPKEDRIQLLRHLRAQVSPVWAFVPAGVLPDVAGETLLDATTPDGQSHQLSALRDTSDTEAVSSALREASVYILDGHHRYETALAYRDECRARASSWTGDEPENFLMVAITAEDDPGLVLLPIHRLVRPPRIPADVIPLLERYLQVEDVTPKSYDGTALLRLMARLTAAGNTGTAFGALGLEEGRLHLLTLRDAAEARALMPEHSATWQSLDVSVLEYAILRDTLGIRSDQAGVIDYTDDHAHALTEVESGRWPLAFLLNATRIEQVRAVADAGERMPAKSTFFWPKLATGLVMYPFE
jgi:uncharacterized protein (DUF1015 family)